MLGSWKLLGEEDISAIGAPALVPADFSAGHTYDLSGRPFREGNAQVSILIKNNKKYFTR